MRETMEQAWKKRIDTNGKEQDELLVAEAWNKLREKEQERKKEMMTGTEFVHQAPEGEVRNADVVHVEAHAERGQRKKTMYVLKKQSLATRMEEEQSLPNGASSESSMLISPRPAQTPN